VKEVSQAELKLLCEKALMQFLATQELLAEEEMGSPLLGLMSLHDQWVIGPLEDLMALVGLGNSSLVSLVLLLEQGVTESLMKMRFPLGQVAQPWVDFLLRHWDIHKLIFHCFFCKCQIKNKCQCSSSRKRTVKVIPVDGALAGSETEDC
jgi:hypothetical protein